MKYGSPFIDPIHDIIETAANNVGLETFRSDDEGKIAGPLRKVLIREIDESLEFVCEGSSFSWYVPYEMGHADGKMPCILLVQKDQSESTQSEVGHIGRSLYAGLRYIPYSLSSRNERGRALVSIEEALRHAIRSISPDLEAVARSLPQSVDHPRVIINRRV